MEMTCGIDRAEVWFKYHTKSRWLLWC